ncbi:MAG: VTT domain-containing protein [Bryobacteraceae bacterium]|nr:VTT domain-containing protein [Bryobacteraceae bacterium]
MFRLAAAAAVMLAAILVPFFLWGEQIEAWAGAFVKSGAGWWQAAAVLAGLLAADVVLPVPSSLLSTAAGALLGFTGGVVSSWLGMTAGCLAGYGLGRWLPPGKLLGDAEALRLRGASEKYGDWMLILFRAVPVLAEASVFFAGLTGMAWCRFLLMTALSNLGISAVYAAAGAFAARRDSFLLAFASAVLIPGAAMLMARNWRANRVIR